jgi:hypothetical protein
LAENLSCLAGRAGSFDADKILCRADKPMQEKNVESAVEFSHGVATDGVVPVLTPCAPFQGLQNVLRRKHDSTGKSAGNSSNGADAVLKGGFT